MSIERRLPSVILRATTEKEEIMSICGTDCCTKCDRLAECGGCEKTGGHPFGGSCAAAECVEKSGINGLSMMKKQLIDEINELGINGLKVDDLNLLSGFFVNLEYSLPNGQTVKFLDDKNVYFGTQIEKRGTDRCYGIAADKDFILVSEYSGFGENPQLILYKKR